MRDIAFKKEIVYNGLYTQISLNHIKRLSSYQLCYVHTEHKLKDEKQRQQLIYSCMYVLSSSS